MTAGAVQGTSGTMSASGDGVRAAVLACAVLAFAGPAVAQTSRTKEPPPPRPPLDIKSVMKDVKPKVARARPKAFKPAEAPAAGPAAAPAGPALASASSTPVILPSMPNPGAAPMMPELKPSLGVAAPATPPEAKPGRRVSSLIAEAERMRGARAELDPLIARHAEANGVPESLVHRVIMRESRYQPRVVSAGNYGLMQIRHGTARAMGYTGSASGLLDAETNLTYAVKYLAGAYKKAHGDERRAIAYYARGY